MKSIKYICSILVVIFLYHGICAIAQDIVQGEHLSPQDNVPGVTNVDSESASPQKMVGHTTIDLDSVFQSHQQQNAEMIKSEIESLKSELKKERDMNDLLMQIAISVVSSILVVLIYYLIRRRTTRKRADSKEKDIAELQCQMKAVNLRIDTALNSVHSQIKNNTVQQEQVRSSQQQDKKKKAQQSHQQQTSPPAEYSTPQQAPVRPANIEYIYLTLSDKRLVPASLGQTAYYRAWHSQGKIFFEFFCDASKAKKAINNRDSLIIPCCVKDTSSIEPNDASGILTVKEGELDSNYQVINKTIIKYV